jgi:ATP-dependent RNA helicase SUPV3L1/SUV3
VQTRLDLWTRTHIERLLAPLFVLGAADDVTGIARGIAYQIVEALGVLERQKVGEEVKSLDQPARATLRKHGVRFGAYHLYVPALLKPGPRALAAQLWAVKHGGPEVKGLDDLQRLAASGRTSFAADKEVQKTLYRTIGYRVCGERAVRVDILERLADLIRPAMTWREGVLGEKPAGAYGGGCFIVTQSMTSLTGSSGEDFASILRSLGYRMEKRPRPQAPAAEAAPASEPSIAEAEATGVEIVTRDEPPAGDNSGPETSLTETNQVASEVSVPAPADASPAAEVAEVTIAGAPAEVLQTADAVISREAKRETEEPALIEVWRTARSEERRGPRRHRRASEHRAPSVEAKAAEGAPAVTSEATSADAQHPAGQPEKERTRSRKGRRPDRRHRPEGEREQRAERPVDPSQADKSRPEKFPRPDRGRRRDEDRPPRIWGSANERGNKEPDPNSPFAKLAALKAQLEANAKERH